MLITSQNFKRKRSTKKSLENKSPKETLNNFGEKNDKPSSDRDLENNKIETKVG